MTPILSTKNNNTSRVFLYDNTGFETKIHVRNYLQFRYLHNKKIKGHDEIFTILVVPLIEKITVPKAFGMRKKEEGKV